MCPVTVSPGSKPERIRRLILNEGTRTRTSIHWVRASCISLYADAPLRQWVRRVSNSVRVFKRHLRYLLRHRPLAMHARLRGLRFILVLLCALDWRLGIRTQNLPLIRRVL